MHTGGDRPDADEANKKDHDRRGERISVGGGDDAVTRIQLAARWAETYAPHQGDSLKAVLQRFRSAYEYLDAVTHGIEPSQQSQEEC